MVDTINSQMKKIKKNGYGKQMNQKKKKIEELKNLIANTAKQHDLKKQSERLIKKQSVEHDNFRYNSQEQELITTTREETYSHHIPQIAIHELFDGYYFDDLENHVYITEETFPVDYKHGHLTLKHALEVTPESLCLIGDSPDLRSFNSRQVLFLDTETTGLSLTAGNYIFLLGCGFFHDDEFLVRQYFMTHYEAEDTMLKAMEIDFEPFSSIVTFNGSLFDVPLLKTRFLMNGRPFQLGSLPHCDLLKCARRLWRRRLRWCNLSNLETQLLGIERFNDVPGSIIPSLYRQFIREQNGAIMKQVFYHNKIDILSMVTLLGLVHQTVTNHNIIKTLPAEDHFSLGRVMQHRGFNKQAISHYQLAYSKAETVELKLLILSNLGNLKKQLGALEEAVEYWQEILDHLDHNDLLTLENLAKYYEHHRKDYKQAIRYCHTALDSLSSIQNDYDEIVINRKAAWEHRLKRLTKKLLRSD